jgi:fructokinase
MNEGSSAMLGGRPGRSIVGIGEILLVSDRDGEHAGGLAAQVALHAARLGYPAVPVSRVGQDPAGTQLLSILRQSGVNTDHVQSDPDLPTGRLTIRTLAGRTTRTLESRGAFDNLQWDFDLEDVGRDCDAVIFGELARREGQTRTTIDRFLTACRHAMRIYDLTNRASDDLQRVLIGRALEFAEGAIVDDRALSTLRPGSHNEPRETVISSLARQHKLQFVLYLDDSGRVRSYSDDPSSLAEATIDVTAKEAAWVALVHGLLCGRDWKQCLNGAARYSRFAADHPGSELPAEMFE